MKLNIYEVLDKFKAAPDIEEKRRTLVANDSFALRCVLRAAFHPNIRFVIDEIPEYRPSDAPAGLADSSLHMDIEKIYLWEENNPRVSPNLTLERKRQLLVQLLESLEAREAEVLAGVIKKDLKVPDLTYELVDVTFPGVLAA
jgi:hypothetical protein